MLVTPVLTNAINVMYANEMIIIAESIHECCGENAED